MELRKGYKQTEVGLIPSDWDVVRIGNCFEFKNGLNKEKHFFGKGTPIVNYMDVYRNPGISAKDLTGSVTLSKEELRNYDVRRGDVFFTRTSETVEEIGISTVVLEELVDTVFSGFVLRARPTNSKFELNYKKYCFSPANIRKQITSTASYTTRALTNGRLLSDIKVPIPSTKAEQIAIATALSDMDALISNLEQLIEKKRNIKQGAIRQLLKPKEGWEIKKLGEIGESIIGLTYKPENVKVSGLLVLRSSNVQGNTLHFEDNVYVDIDVPTKIIVQANDILICVRNGSRDLIGKCALIKGHAIGETFGAFMAVFRSPYNEYVFNIFQSSIIKRQIDEHLGATINQITNKSLNSFEIPFPSSKEQEIIVRILSDMDAEISAFENKLNKIKALKQGMIQNLLTGKIRLRKP